MHENGIPGSMGFLAYRLFGQIPPPTGGGCQAGLDKIPPQKIIAVAPPKGQAIACGGGAAGDAGEVVAGRRPSHRRRRARTGVWETERRGGGAARGGGMEARLCEVTGMDVFCMYLYFLRNP